MHKSCAALFPLLYATPRIITITPLNRSHPPFLPDDDWFRLFIGSPPRSSDFLLCHFETVETFARLSLPLLSTTRTEYIKINICSLRREQSRSLTDTRVLHTMRPATVPLSYNGKGVAEKIFPPLARIILDNNDLRGNEKQTRE